MMQSLLLLRNPETNEVDRIINIDLMSTAYVHSENAEWTRVICGLADITIHMKFSDFLKSVETLVAQNYKSSLESAAFWHEKRLKDQGTMMEDVLKNIHS
jgi:hypothetical protein